MNRTNARAIFKNMPDEVFELYIAPLIQDLGWHYTAATAIVSKGWYEAFDNSQLNAIVELQWERLDTYFSSLTFHPNSADRLNWILQAHIDGRVTPCSNVKNGKQRLESSLAYIRRSRRLPNPVVFMKSYQGFRILDGNHRLAAALEVSRTINTRVPYWLGSKPSSFSWGSQC